MAYVNMYYLHSNQLIITAQLVYHSNLKAMEKVRSLYMGEGS